MTLNDAVAATFRSLQRLMDDELQTGDVRARAAATMVQLIVYERVLAREDGASLFRSAPSLGTGGVQ